MVPEILVATPCYNDCITNTYFRSVLKAIAHFKNTGSANLHFFTVADSLVTRARNVCAAIFLKNSLYTHLMFVDADIGFEPEDIERLLEKHEPFVCSPYPIKRYNFDKVREIDSGKLERMTGDEIRAKLLRYNVHVSKNIGNYSREIMNGFMEIDRAGTGFMLIRREVFDLMMKEYPMLRYKSHDAQEKQYEDFLWLFFDCMVDDDNHYLSEDFAFCERWRNLGGKIWLDLKARLTHTGIEHFRGDMVQVMNIGTGQNPNLQNLLNLQK